MASLEARQAAITGAARIVRETPKALTETDVRRIIREEQDRDRSVTEAIERLEGLLRDRRERGATRLTEQTTEEEWTQPYKDALTAIAVTTCREWCDEKADRCNAPAEFLIWGKLTPPNGLGPRCYDHAAEHVGHQALGDPSWAIVDLRPALRLLGESP